MINKRMLYVDFNEMIERNLVLLSAKDNKVDINGSVVMLHEGLQIIGYMDDVDYNGKPDNLIAAGVVQLNRTSNWASHVKWCLRIDSNGIRHESEIRKHS